MIMVLGVLSVTLLSFGIGGLIPDYIFPRIPLLRKFVHNLPLYREGD